MLLVKFSQREIFVFTLLVVSSSFWNLSPVRVLINDVTLYVLFGCVLVWGLTFKRKIGWNDSLPILRYEKYIYLIWISVFFSMLSAALFWNQPVLLTLIAQRWLYMLAAGIVLLRVQPTLIEIVTALRWFSGITVIIWMVSLSNPRIIFRDEIHYDLFSYYSESDSVNARSYISGVPFVLLLFFYECSTIIKQFATRGFLVCTTMMMFFVQYKNRSLLIGVAAAYLFTIVKIGKKRISVLLPSLLLLAICAGLFARDIVLALTESTIEQLADPEYARWRAVNYFLFDYPKNFWCYIFGNGFPVGGKSDMGNLMWANFADGIYANDLGLFGMWIDYGALLIISIYWFIFSVIRSRTCHLSLKMFALHMLFVPSIFHFWANPGVFYISLLIYMFALTERGSNL